MNSYKSSIRNRIIYKAEIKNKIKFNMDKNINVGS